MSEVACYWLVCFVPPPPVPELKIFGLAEYLTAATLLIVFLQVVDFRYRFRLSLLPRWLRLALVGGMVFVGVGTLLMELWLYEGWWTPVFPVSPVEWQFIFAGTLLLIFLVWIYFTYVAPPRFSRWNALRYANAVLRVIVNGDESEVRIVADELTASAYRIVDCCATSLGRPGRHTHDVSLPMSGQVAAELLMALGNRRLCRHIVRSSQRTAIQFFAAAEELKRAETPLGPMFASLLIEAVDYSDSALYHEDHLFSWDLLVRLKPWRRSLFGYYPLLENMARQPLAGYALFDGANRWNGSQWNAFTRAGIDVVSAYASTKNRPSDSRAISVFCEAMERGGGSLNIDASETGVLDSMPVLRIEAIGRFCAESIACLEKADPTMISERKLPGEYDHDTLGRLADVFCSAVVAVAPLKGSFDVMWHVQYGALWGEFHGDGPVHAIFWKRVARKFIRDLEKYDKHGPNFVTAKIVGSVLNVVGLTPIRPDDNFGEVAGLARICRGWARKYFRLMLSEDPDLAEAMLVGNLTFDSESGRLCKTYRGRRTKPGSKEYLAVR